MTLLHLISKALYWLFILVPVTLFLKTFQVLLGWAFIAPFVKADGHLPYPLRSLFEPDDTLAIGDEMFRSREMAGITSYYRLAEAWGRRNPAYGYDALVGCPADITILKSYGKSVDWGYDGQENAIYTTGIQIILAEHGYWNLRLAFIIPFTTRGLLCSFGWNLLGEVVNSNTRNLKIDIAMKTTGKNKT
jgi:hypothetical protein